MVKKTSKLNFSKKFKTKTNKTKTKRTKTNKTKTNKTKTKKTKTKKTKTKKTKTKKTKTKKTKTNSTSSKKFKNKITNATYLKSYNPSINLISSLKSLNSSNSLNKDIFKCKNDLININDNCYNWKSKKVKKTMLKLLLKKNVNAENIIGPKQIKSNCWFNTFLMVFFVSDKGRKFHRFFRKAMIEGKIYSKNNNTNTFEQVKFKNKLVNSKLKYPMFLLNYYIEMCLQGNIKNIKVNKKFNTNNIIKKIYEIIDDDNIYDIDKSGNPLKYYTTIFNYLLDSKENNPISSINFKNATIKKVNEYVKFYKINPKIIFLKYDIHNDFKHEKIKVNNKIYKLDSVVLRDNLKHHFSCYITCNKKDYGFDGASNQPLQPFDWKNKLNKNIDFNFKGLPKKIKFNFTIGYSIYAYYRH